MLGPQTPRVAVALFCALTTGATAGAVQRRDRPPQPTPPAALTAEPGCSAGRHGGPTLSVSWRGTRAGLARQRLDITAHKGGFEKGLFVTLDRIERGVHTRRSSPADLPARFFRTALALTATSVAVDARAGSVRVDLEGVQPGLYYFVRMSTENVGGWVAGPAVHQPIPPCVVEDEEVRRRR